MEFRLVHTEVPLLRLDKLNLSESGSPEESQEGGAYKLGLNVFLDPIRPNTFGVLFEIDLTHHNEFKLLLHYLSWFESPEPIQKEDVDSPFARINAPAIAFPYLRSFVSLVTLNSGFRLAILPTVNFVKMYQEFEAGNIK